jgi:hypothetical protein
MFRRTCYVVRMGLEKWFGRRKESAPEPSPEQIDEEIVEIEKQLGEIPGQWDQVFDSESSPDAKEDLHQMLHTREDHLRDRLLKLEQMRRPEQ